MKATETTILKFIGGFDKAFIIPPFQRNYEWGKEECFELFSDIVRSCHSGKSHYLGNVIYFEGKSSGASYTEIVLVDGQQRVTTVLILLCAIRDMIDDQNVKDSINKRYLLNDTNDSKYRIRLKQTAYDSSSFMSIIDGDDRGDSSGNVTANYKLFKTLVKDCGITPMQIYETIPKLEVVEVNLQATNELEAVQTVFEKINSTGKELTPADLIRNLLLLTHSADEQERLYMRYWLIIEETLKSENISRFARDFLIMKTFSDVPEKQIYKLFKSFFHDIHAHNEDVLDEMSKFSKFYVWIRFESCPDDSINRSLKMLNILKTDDVYPLYLYLLFNMFESQKNELRRIFVLLTDFLLRYRIVTPAGGGGALRSVVQELIENLNIDEVGFTWNSILFELSNSATPTGRFPDDVEFKQNLLSNVNASYARVLLLKIEEYETRNIPVDISKTTIEHLMPQTLSDWWKENLGGETEAEKTHAEYLNCIGNLAPVSQSYNSTMSNKPWDEKRQNLQDVQFVVTSEIAAQYVKWDKESISDRNETMANRALQAITSPLKRTRSYRTKNPEDYSPGIYPVTDTAMPMNGSSIVTVRCADRVIECSRWKDLLVNICLEIFARDPLYFNRIVADNMIHKATSKKNYPEKDPIISASVDYFIEPMQIVGTDYYCEGCLSNNRARVYTKQLLELFECADEYSIEIV
jgi:uncharacterized protein with ParB-like and HNH nuclease domain